MVLAKIIAEYANWTDDERTHEMFKVNSRRKLTLIHAASNERIILKRNEFNRVIMYGFANWCAIYVEWNDFVKATASGKLKLFLDKKYHSNVPDELVQEIINRWNSL